MKRNLLTALLMAALFVNAAGSAFLSYQYVRSVRLLQKVQYQRGLINREMSIFQALLNDTLEYSKKNPKIEPLLQTILKPKTTNASVAPRTPAN
jgi:hypothetical protein